MRVSDKTRNVRDLRIGDVPDAAPPNGGLVIRRRERGQRGVPGRVKGRVRELHQGCVEEVVARGEGLDLLEWGVAGSDDGHCGLGEDPVCESGEEPGGAQGLKCFQDEGQSPIGHGRSERDAPEEQEHAKPDSLYAVGFDVH